VIVIPKYRSRASNVATTIADDPESPTCIPAMKVSMDIHHALEAKRVTILGIVES
jgi:hypothetical protein